MSKKGTFEETIIKLEEIVEKLEESKASLDETIELYQEGIKLSALCNKMIDEAQQKIKILSGKKDELKEIDFEETGE